MKTSENKILITGGSAGIGLEIAKLFLEQGNHVLITGRNSDRLEEALKTLPGAQAIQGDVSDLQDVERLVTQIKTEHPDLNILINNAGTAFVYSLGMENEAYSHAREEIITNYLSVINLIDQLLPVLNQQHLAAVVNVTSRVAYVPSGRTPTYSASKAALHVYTQLLREQLAKATRIQVYELMPPLVNTIFSQEIGGAAGIPAKEVAEELLNAMNNDQLDVPVGKARFIHDVFREAMIKASR